MEEGAAAQVAVIVGSPDEEALLREQHQAYTEDAACRSSSSSSSNSTELMQRADFLERNAAAIEANSGDYTTWHLRRRYLTANPQHLNEKELRYVRNFCSENLKNYQAWFHRRWLLKQLPLSLDDLKEETESLKKTLAMELKNYNSWSHKAFLVSFFDSPIDEELQETEHLLSLDPFSNSAFSHMFFLVQRKQQKQQDTQCNLWFQQIAKFVPWFEDQPSNESVVRYLLGCLDRAAATAAQQQQQQQQLQETLELLMTAAARAAAAKEGGERFGLEIGVAVDTLRQNYRAAAAKCVRLKTADPVRRFYWSWRSMLLGKKDLSLQMVA